mgnify:CR=1 FL=1
MLSSIFATTLLIVSAQAVNLQGKHMDMGGIGGMGSMGGVPDG